MTDLRSPFFQSFFKKSARGVLITAFSFLPYILFAQQNPVLFSENGKSGIKDSNGEILVPAKYTALGWSDGFELFVDNIVGYYNGNWGLISAKNEVITNANYYELWPVHKDLIIASRKGKFSNKLFYGALNSKGQAVIGFKYASIDRIVDLLIVSKEEDHRISYGLLNEKNQFLLEPEYSRISHFSEDVYVFSDFENKSGLIEKTGRVVMPVSVDKIDKPQYNFAKVYQQGQVGLIGLSGNTLIKPEYKSIKLGKDKTTLLPFQTINIVGSNNEIFHSFSCDSLVKLSETFYAIYRNDHITLTDPSFNTLLSGTNIVLHEPQSDKLVISQSGTYKVLDQYGKAFLKESYDSIASDTNYFYVLKNDTWSVINKFGRKISRQKYEAIQPASEGLIAMKRRGYWGYIDFRGDEVIPPKFDEVSNFLNLVAKVRFLDAYGSINQFGDWVCEPVYDTITLHENGLNQARIKSRTDLIDKNGTLLFQTYNQLVPFGKGFIEQTAEGKKGFISAKGEVLKHPIYDEISFTPEDNILITEEDNYLSLTSDDGQRFYDLSGKYEEVLGKKEDFVGVKLDGKYGFVDMQGRLRIANRYDSIRLFSDGMAAFFLRGHWGYIDKSEKLRVQPHYDQAFDFIDGTAIVEEDGKYLLIDKNGRNPLEAKFDRIKRNKFGSFITQLNGKYGIYSASSKKILETEYTSIQELAKGEILVKRRGKYGLVNEAGRFTLPMIYDHITRLPDGKYKVERSFDSVVKELAVSN